MSRAVLAVLAAAALALLAATAPAQAQERQAGVGSFEFQMGQYRPLIDSEFVPTPGAVNWVGPWESSFGTSRRWMFKLHGGKALFSGYGTLELGGGIGYLKANGHGLVAAGPLVGQVSQEKTGFTLVPLAVDLTYRLDFIWERFSVPLVPYGRVALLRDLWWVSGSGGKSSKSGATDGWGWGGGLALVLDFIDPVLTRELARDTGIQHTMLLVEVQKAKVNDFGSKYYSWDLSNDGPMITFGLGFAF